MFSRNSSPTALHVQHHIIAKIDESCETPGWPGYPAWLAVRGRCDNRCNAFALLLCRVELAILRRFLHAMDTTPNVAWPQRAPFFVLISKSVPHDTRVR